MVFLLLVFRNALRQNLRHFVECMKAAFHLNILSPVSQAFRFQYQKEAAEKFCGQKIEDLMEVTDGTSWILVP